MHNRVIFPPDFPGDLRTVLETKEPYGLVPAVYNGLFDVAPPGLRFVDGNENAFTCRNEADYLRHDNQYRQAIGEFLRYALDTSDEYVWVWGEQCHWWSKRSLTNDEHEALATSLGQGRLWEEVMPGITARIEKVRGEVGKTQRPSAR